MSIPAWKQAILEKKKQQEEAEKKKQQEKEQYLASLPPWKRAMLKVKADGKAASNSPNIEKRVVNAFAGSTSYKPSWVQTRVKKDDSNEKPPLQNGDVSRPQTDSSVETNVTQQQPASGTRKISKAMAMKDRFEQPKDKSSQPFSKKDDVQKDETNVKPRDNTTLQSTKETEEEKKSVEKSLSTYKVANEKPVVKEAEAPSTDSGLNKLRGQFEHQSAGRNPIHQTRPSSLVDNMDDEKFKLLPKWKQELILRKKQKNVDSPKLTQKATEKKNTPPVSSNSTLPPSVSNKDQSSPIAKNPPVSPTQTSFPQSKPSQTPTATTPTPKEEVVPEVINASNKKDADSPKMVHREGKELKPPVFTVKSKWADMKEDDPDFKSLPEWKRTLILRRKNDYKTRTAPPEEKKEEKKEEKNDPLPEPLWTPPTRSIPVREIPNEPEKEEKNPLLDMRKSLRHVKRPSLTPEEEVKKPSGIIQPKIAENEIIEADESLSPLKPKQDKPKKKLRRVSWSDTDLNNSLTVEFTYPKYSYEDYFDIDQSSVEEKEVGGESTDSSELATPIHPSLSSPTKNSNSLSTSSSTGLGSFGDSSDVSSSFGSGSTKTFSFSGMPSLGSFMSAYTTGSMTDYSSPASSNNSKPVEKQNPIEDTGKVEEEEIDENAAALLW